jgi:hypothetical protein
MKLTEELVLMGGVDELVTALGMPLVIDAGEVGEGKAHE